MSACSLEKAQTLHLHLVVVQSRVPREGMIYFHPVLCFVFYLFTAGFSVPVTVRNEHNHGKSLSGSICIYHTHISTPTQTAPRGAVVDNSLYSTPDASVGIVVFMLKQQERKSAEFILWSLSDC